MADLQISALPAISEANIQATDVLALADLSATETKKVTVKDLVAAAVALLDTGDIPAAKVATPFAANAVATATLQNLAVTTAKIANGAITATQITDATITGGKLAADTITATQIAANAVTASELADNAVDTAAIANGSVTTVKIADANVTYAKLNLSDGDIPAAKLTSGSVTATQLATNSVTANELADNAVDANAIASGVITGAKIASTTIAAGNIVNNTITGTQIANGAINTNQIANGAVTAAKISGTLEATSLADNAVTTAKIINDAVTSAKLAANAVDAAALADNAVDAGAIATGAVTNAKLATNAVTNVKITDGTITAAKLNTSNIDRSLNVASGNLGINNAVSGGAATRSGITYNAQGLVTSTVALAASDIPIATASAVGGVSVGTGLAVSGAGALSLSNSVTGATVSGITFSNSGQITAATALVPSDLPVSTTSAKGAVQITSGGGLTVDGSGNLTTSTSGISAGTYQSITVNNKGVATAGAGLTESLIPVLPASKITSGTLDAARIGADTIDGTKLSNSSTTIIQSIAQLGYPTALFTGQLLFDPIAEDAFLWDGNAWNPITTLTKGALVRLGTYNASTSKVDFVTSAGAAAGLTVGANLPVATSAVDGGYVVVSVQGTPSGIAGITGQLSPPDYLLGVTNTSGSSYVEIDLSTTVASQVASAISYTPFGQLQSTNVQAALDELETEKVAKAGSTITGELLIGNAGSLVFEGATADAFETTLTVADPTTSDKTITLPNVTGTVITTGDTNTVTSTMVDGSLVNTNLAANAAIAFSKLAALTSAQILVGNGSNVVTGVAVTGDISINNAGLTAIASGVIVDGDISGSAAITGSKVTTGTTSAVGVLQLTNSAASTSTTTAATPAAVKTAKDAADAAATTANAAVAKSGSTMTGNLTIDNAKELRLSEADGDGANYTGLKAQAQAADIVLTLPAVAPTTGQVLKSSSTATTLEWATDSATDSSKLPLAGGTLTGNLTLNAQSDVRFADADSSHFVALQSPATVASSFTLTLPSTDAAVSGYVLASDGSGTLSWVDPGSSSSPTFTGDATLTNDGALIGFSNLSATYTGNTKTLTVTVASKTGAHRYNGSGSSSGYKIGGKESPFLTLTPGRTYKFDQADNSNSGHPLRFYLEADKTTAYTTGVTTNGTAGSSGAYTQIVVSDTTPQILHYQCSAHALMGNSVQTNSNIAATPTQLTVTANNTTDETVYPLFVDGATGAQGAESDTGLTYNPSTGLLTAVGFSGAGTSLTALNASNLGSGTVPDSRFPATLPAASGVNLTALNATNLSSGSVATARLGSGTASSSTFLRGDGSWQSVPAATPGGSNTQVQYNNSGSFGGAASLTFNAASGALTATSFVGALTGNVTGTASNNAVLTGSTNNTIATVTGANALQGEANLTFANAGSDPILTVTNSGHAQLQLTNTSGADNCSINFGDSDDNDVGEIIYNHPNNRMEFYVNGTQALTLDSSQNATFAKQVKVLSSSASSVAFSVGDAGTGFYNSGSNAIGYAANGTQKWNIDSTGNLTVTGTVTATSFSGSGASLTSLPASQLTGSLPAISGANLTNLPSSGGSITLTAGGSISAGDTVVANSSGQAVKVTQSVSLNNPPVASYYNNSKSADSWPRTVYDSTTDRFVCVYKYSSTQVSSNVFQNSGSGVTVPSTKTNIQGNSGASHALCHLAPGKVLTVIRRSDGKFTPWVGVINATTNEVAWTNHYSATGYSHLRDSNNSNPYTGETSTWELPRLVKVADNKAVFFWQYGGLNAIVITYNTGSTQWSCGATSSVSSNNVNQVCKPVWDSTNSRLWTNVDADTDAKVRCAYISGSTLYWGTARNVNAGGQGNAYSLVHDPSVNRMLFTYRVGSTHYITTLTLSGSNNITQNSTNTFGEADDRIEGVYAEHTGTIMYAYYSNSSTTRMKNVDASTSSQTQYSTGQLFSSPAYDFYGAYDPVNKQVIMTFTRSSKIQFYVLNVGGATTNATSYIGCSAGSYSYGATATINVAGGTNNSQSGLSAGQRYFVGDTGALTTTEPESGVVAGIALSSTKLLIK